MKKVIFTIIVILILAFIYVNYIHAQDMIGYPEQIINTVPGGIGVADLADAVKEAFRDTAAVTVNDSLAKVITDSICIGRGSQDVVIYRLKANTLATDDNTIVLGDTMAFTEEALVECFAEIDSSGVLFSYSSNDPVISFFDADGGTATITFSGDSFSFANGTAYTLDGVDIATREDVTDSLAANSYDYATNTDVSDSLAANSYDYATNTDVSDSLSDNSNDFATRTDVSDSLSDNSNDFATRTDVSDSLALAVLKEAVRDSIVAVLADSTLRDERSVDTDSTMTTANFPSGCTISISGTSEITLPTAVAGMHYRFITVGTDSCIVLAGASDNIDYVGGTDSANIVATGTADEVLELEAVDNTNWKVVNSIGTWETY